MKAAMIDMMLENNVRAEAIIHLPTMLAQDAWPEVAEEAFMQEDPDEIWKAIGIEEPYDLDDQGLIHEYLRDERKWGYLVKFATPVPQDVEADHHRLSWGYYAMKWIYADTYEKACELALDWREEFVERKRKKALKDMADGQDQLENFGPTCPECGEGGMHPTEPEDPNCQDFWCGECLFNEPEEGSNA